jgi:hypothetical protein
MTIDCTDPPRLAAFWRTALGYADAPVPEGFATREEWLTRWEVPPQEWDDAAYLHDPRGIRPSITFLKVPEPKAGKNRLHIDIKAAGRDLPHDTRWPAVTATVHRLTAAGATVLREESVAGIPSHVVMADPEGNEFCVV